MVKKILGIITRGQQGQTIEILGTIFMSQTYSDRLSVNVNGEYYHIALGKLKKLIKKQDNYWENKLGQRKLNQQSNVLSITAKIWRQIR
jgi:hypothetical protein